MKMEGKSMNDHPVLQRLTNLKSLLQQLAPLDEVLEDKIKKVEKANKKEEKKV